MKEVFEELETIRRTSMANSVEMWIPQGLAQYMRQTAEKAEHIENLLREELNSDKEKQIAVLGKKIVSLEEENKRLKDAISEANDTFRKMMSNDSEYITSLICKVGKTLEKVSKK